MRRLVLVSAVAAVAFGSWSGAALGSGQRPNTETVHVDDPPYIEAGEEVCDGQTADLRLDDKGVFHITEFEDGRYHVTGTFRGTFAWEQGGATRSGHFTLWFGENSNSKTFNGTFTLNGEGRGSDGAKVQVKGLGHITINANGVVTKEIDRFSITCR